MNYLKIDNLQVNYDKECIINDLNLQVKSGELLVILGPSGCGKSTLLSAISGLTNPCNGTIAFGDECVYSKCGRTNIAAEKRNLGFVFQDYAIWPHMNVFNNIAYPLKVKKTPKFEREKRVSEILEIVNLEDKESSYPNELSGGEKQRVAIARAIALNPSMLLLDEPFANLDTNLKGQLMKEIKKIQEKLGITMIYVTHDQNVAFEMADRIIIMKKGKIVQEGNPQEVYLHPKNKFVARFLGESNIIESNSIHKHKFCNQLCKKINKDSAICIRPEDVEMSANGKSCGRIDNIMFKGSRCNYVVESDGARLIVSSDSNLKIEVGEDVKFNIKRYHEINKNSV